MLCKNCSSPLPQDAVFCSVCGTRVEITADPAPPVQPPVRYCCKCGGVLGENAVFCVNCGADQRQEPQPKPAKKKKLGLILGIVGGGVALIAVVLTLIFTGAFQTPAQRFRTMLEMGVIDPVIAEVRKGSDTDFSTDMLIQAKLGEGNALEQYGIDRYVDDCAVELKLDANSEATLAEAVLLMEDNDLLSATVTYEDGVLGAYLPDLDREYYTLNLQDMMAEISDGSFDIDFDSAAFDAETLAALLERYSDIILGCINNDNVRAGKEDVRLGYLRETVEGCTVYTFAPREEDIEKMVIALADAMREDEYLAELENALRDSGWSFDIGDVADAMEDSARDVAENMTDGDFTITFAVRGTKFVMAAVNSYDGELRAEIFSEDGGSDIAVLMEIDGEESWVLSCGYTEDGSNVDGTLEFSIYEEPVFTTDFDLDMSKKSALEIYYGTYSLEFAEWGEPVVMEVTGAETGTAHVVRLENLSDNNALSDLAYTLGEDFSVTVTTTDQASTAQKPDADPRDISSYSADELMDIVYGWGDGLGEIFSDIFY